MNTKIALLAAALAAMAPAYAGNSGNPITELANYTGLSERRVQMIVGCRTCHAEYVYTYGRSLEKFKRALGNERYERLMAGFPIELESQGEDPRVIALGSRHDVPLP